MFRFKLFVVQNNSSVGKWILGDPPLFFIGSELDRSKFFTVAAFRGSGFYLKGHGTPSLKIGKDMLVLLIGHSKV